MTATVTAPDSDLNSESEPGALVDSDQVGVANEAIVEEVEMGAKKTAIFPANKALEYLSLGLVGEAGEVANKVKKIIRDKKIDVDIGGEIGDVLWYCAMLADYLDVDLGTIMENNINKLQSRKSRGVLGGSGDKR